MTSLSDDELAGRHPATTGMLRWFNYSHLPDHLQEVSRPVAELVDEMVGMLPDGPELTTGLRKLLEAKDALVRAAIEGTITRERGWVAPNARDAVAGTEVERDADGTVAMTALPDVPTRSHGMDLGPGAEQCAATYGDPLTRCMYLDGHLERHATPDGRRFDA